MRGEVNMPNLHFECRKFQIHQPFIKINQRFAKERRVAIYLKDLWK